MSHEQARRKETQKYQRESCYHRIKCTTATFLVAFMRRRPLNSAALATVTHRKPKGVSDRTNIQVRAQMINKCRIKMDQGGLYNMKNPPWERRRENGRQICNRVLRVNIKNQCPRTNSRTLFLNKLLLSFSF